MRRTCHLATLVSTAAVLAWQNTPAHARTWVYVQEASPLLYRPGTSPPDQDWTSPDYQEDASWVPSNQGFGIGYGDGDDRTVLEDMRGHYLTVYVRAHFSVGTEQPQTLKLRVLFDDGFVVYVNGQEVGRSHVPNGPLSPDDPASGHEVTDGPEEFDLDPSLLRPGDNVLAAEVHNSDLSSSDLSFLPLLWGWDEPPPQAEIVIGPFVQQVGRRSALVVWETDVAAPTWLAWGPAGAGPIRSIELDESVTHHVVTLEGLVPARGYVYQVQSAAMPSRRAVLTTMKDRDATFTFGIFGDDRSGHEAHRAVVQGLLGHHPDAVFNTGDLVGDGTDESDWRTFFDIEADLVSSTSLYPTLGNHEADGGRYLEIFELPDGDSGTERYYSVVIGPALFVVLDLYGSDFGPGSDQYQWLEASLAAAAQDPNVRHVFVLLHHGPYDSGRHGSDMQVRNDLVPLFEQYGVEAVFSGHDHCYERGTVHGIKYVVTGGGGAPLYDVSGDWWTEVAEATYHYCVLTVTGPVAHFTAYREDGSELDSFDLGGPADECTNDADCTDQPQGACEADEEGSWRCVQGACLWTCHVASTPPADGGVDAAVGDGGVVAADAESDGGSQAREEGGCGCRSSEGPGGLLWLVAALVLGWFRRRTERRSNRSGTGAQAVSRPI